jgi:hypothetical protein
MIVKTFPRFSSAGAPASFLRLLLLAVAICAAPLLATADELVPAGSIWRYRDNGTNQGTAWRGTSFNDSAWATGAAELGYGDGDEATTVSYGPNANNKYVTTYFRHTFNVTDPGAFTSLTLSTLRDDGAVVYLNGVEVWRSDNMPAGTIGYQTYASWALGSPEEETFYDAQVAPSLLVAGQNVLAVEVHQADPTSTDISFDLRLEGLTTFVVTRGPYLQMGTPTSMLVRWRTNGATNSRVRYGTTPGDLNVTVDDAALTTEHQVALTALTPSTTYYYSVGTTAETLAGDASHTFLTPPPVSTEIPTRIWILGDSGAANADARAVRDAYYSYPGATNTNLWLMLGDNAYEEGTDAEFQAAVFDMYPTMLRRSVLWPTLGNHDTAHSSTVTPALPYFVMFSLPTAGEAGGVASGTEKYYSFNYGNIHFICLDSMTSDRSATGPMLTWMESDLAATTQKWIIAFWHHPPYSKGSHDSDDETELVQMRMNALPILEDYGVDLVLSGHSHSYERSYLLDSHYGTSNTLVSGMIKDGGSGRPEETGAYSKPTSGLAPHEGAVYAVAGSSSVIQDGPLDHPAMFISMIEYGSMILDVNGDRLDAKFLRKNGVVADSFTIIKGPPAVAPDAPGALSATAISTTAIDLTWTDNSTNEERFTLERCTGTAAVCDATPALYAQIAQPAANATAYGDSGLTPNTTYSYRIRAENTYGNSAYSNTATATTQPCQYEVTPTSFTFPASGGTGEATITTTAACAWESSSNVAWITLDSGASGTGSGVTAFTVAANDGAERNGTITVAGTVIPITQAAIPPPATPGGVSAQAYGNSEEIRIRVAWSMVPNATGYEVLRASASSPMAPVGIVAAGEFDTVVFDDDTVAEGTAYRYAVRALNAGGASPNSASDIAVAMIFTDGALPAGTRVKLVHLSERRSAVNAVRALAGLAPFSFTDAAVPGLRVRAIHINQLRTALDEALTALGYAGGGYTGTVTSGTVIQAVHFREISDRVR